ncbi:hypothetical protein LTR53_005209 [Teratosphaeriaceae sp. CCFEE 6253]|nr:hypothetical protein LTR53_005209 [Teratosphaeriaceae sp. CCFEE 6253]
MGPKRKADEQGAAVSKPSNPMAGLQDAVRRGNKNRLGDILRTAKFELPFLDVLAIALSMSCHKGHLEIVEYLLLKGADPNAAVKGRPLVPLVQAVEACQAPDGEAQNTNAAQQSKSQRDASRHPDTVVPSANSQPDAIEQERTARLDDERQRRKQLRLEKTAQDQEDARQKHADRLAIVKLLLEHNAKPDVKDVKGRTPLMLAKTRDVAQLLLDHGADVLALDQEGMSALMHARQLDLVELLLSRGADIEARDGHQRTALMLTVIEDADSAIALCLITRGADLEAADDMGRTILVTAVWRNRVTVVERLLAKQVNVSRKDARGRNVLHHFAGDSDRRLEPEDGDGPKIFRLLLGNAEDGDLKLRDIRERTPLHWAAATGNLSAARAILARPNAMVDPLEHKSKTPLHLLVRLAPSLEDIERMDYRSDTGSVSGAMSNPKATQRQQEMIRRQLKIREKAKQEEQQKRTELLRRINALFALLVQNKSNVNAEAEGGWTPLHIACQEQTVVEIVEQLLANGADRNRRTHTGKTGFHIACEAGNLRIVKHLIADQATSVNTKDNFGNSPLLAAASCGYRNIVDLLTPWSKRQIDDLSADAKGAAEQFHATVLDFGGYKRGNEVKKVRVYDLLYTDPNIASPVSSSTVCKGSTVFRWIHLPANNVSWCQALLTKRFIEEGAEDGPGFKALQRSFLHQHGGQRWHSNYMRPGCQAVPRSKRSPAPDREATPRISVNVRSQSPASSRFSDDGTAPDEAAAASSRSPNTADETRPHMADQTAQTRGGALAVPDDTNADGSRLRRPRGASFSHDLRTTDGLVPPVGLANLEPGGPKSRPDPSRRVVISNVASSADHNVYMFAPYLHFETDTQRREMQEVARRTTQELDDKKVRFGSDQGIKQSTPDELLIKAFLKPPVSELHIRRTLDQSFYRTIDTAYRDKTQVVYRYMDAQQNGGAVEPLKILMVDQLWMWIVGKDLVLTSFAQRWQQPKEDPLNVLESTIEEINSNGTESVENIFDLAIMIGGRCFGTFDRSSITRDGSRFLDMFESSIGVAMDKETTLFGQFKDASQQVSLDLQRRQQSLQRAEHLEQVAVRKGHEDVVWQSSRDVRAHSHKKEKAIETLLDIGLETELLSEVKDIRDELDIMRIVFDQQNQVLDQAYAAMELILGTADEPQLHGGTAAERRKITKRLDYNRRAVDHSVKEIDRMDKQAERIYYSMRDLLDLKQKYANAIEARFSRIQAEQSSRQGNEMARQGRETARQGQTLMVFTIATVLFLPLSFISSVLALHLSSIPEAMSLSYASKYIFGIGLTFAMICVLFALCWTSIERAAKKVWDWIFPRAAAAHQAKAELKSPLDLSLMEHHTIAAQKAEVADLEIGAVRARSWQRYTAHPRPSLNEHFVGYQV